MSVETAKKWLERFGFGERVREFDVSSATVPLAALALGVAEARIAKTLSFLDGEACFLVVAAGDARIDNRKFRDCFHVKAKMPTPEQVADKVGHPVGGVCPFGVREGVAVYLDNSLRRFETVFPAAGSGSSAVELTPEELYSCSGALGWVDVCRLP